MKRGLLILIIALGVLFACHREVSAYCMPWNQFCPPSTNPDLTFSCTDLNNLTYCCLNHSNECVSCIDACQSINPSYTGYCVTSAEMCSNYGGQSVGQYGDCYHFNYTCCCFSSQGDCECQVVGSACEVSINNCQPGHVPQCYLTGNPSFPCGCECYSLTPTPTSVPTLTPTPPPGSPTPTYPYPTPTVTPTPFPYEYVLIDANVFEGRSCVDACRTLADRGCISVGTNLEADNFKKRGWRLSFCANYDANCHSKMNQQFPTHYCVSPYGIDERTFWTICKCGGPPLPEAPTPAPQPILCENRNEIDTAIGCIPVDDINRFSAFIIRWAIGMGGGISFLLILLSGFIIITSSGNPQKVKAGKELLTSAISGLILIIFSVFILEIVGLRIFRIPGL